VVVSIGKERAIKIGDWGSFGADDYFNVLVCCEEYTYIRPVESPRAEGGPDDTFSPIPNRESVEDCLAEYRRLLDRNRKYIRDQWVILARLTDFASWQGAGKDGTLKRLKRSCDSRDALMASPEARTIVGSIERVTGRVKGLSSLQTQDDMRLRKARERVRSQIDKCRERIDRGSGTGAPGIAVR
jgi:hypothetical protein